MKTTISRIMFVFFLSILVPFNSFAASVFWDFSTGLPSYLKYFENYSSFSLNDTSELRISKPAGGPTPPSGLIYGGIVSNFEISGNFIIQVDYQIYDQLNYVDQVQLNINYGNMQHNFSIVRDCSYEAPGDNETTDQNYHIWIGSYQNPVQTNDQSGTLRFQRVDNNVTASYKSPGGSFIPLHTFPSYGVENVKFSMTVQNNYNIYNSLDASFDNLYIQADYLPVPAPSSLLLLVSGLLALGALDWRRRS